MGILPSLDVEVVSDFELVTDWPLGAKPPVEVVTFPVVSELIPLMAGFGTAASRGSAKDRFPGLRELFAGLLAFEKP